MKKDENNSLPARTICTRSVTTSTLTPERRSTRGTPSKKPITPASGTRKSERLALSPASQRSDKGKNVLSQNSRGSDKSGRNSDTSSEKKDKRKNNIEESTDKIKKKEPTMSARSYRALFRGKLKQSEALVNAPSNDEELVVVGCSRRVPAGNDDANSVSKRLPVGTDIPLNLIRDTENVVLDAPPMVETRDDSVIGSPSENSETHKLLVSKTSLETDIHLPLKRKRDTAEIGPDACAKVANGEDCVMSSNGVIPSPSGCKINNQAETCSTCAKRQKVNGVENLSVCSCIAQPAQESDHVAQDMRETGPSTSRNYGENRNNMQQDNSYDPKLHSSLYPEYWIPVQLSGVQLEQYCRTLFSKSLSLFLLPKNDFVGALEETLVSVRKTCDHPYVMDASLKQRLTKNLEVHELLDVEVEASGKLHLLDAMLNQIKKKGLKAVVFYQATQSTEGLLLGNILEDFVGQRFGQKSYEHGIYEHGIFSSRKNAINNFNKESQCFVLLLEKRACSPSIKLLRAEVLIIFGSSLNPSHDVKHIEKIKIESYSETTKIFRMYSTFTIEERALILARQNKPVENLHRALTHGLLMWGASYLFDRLDHFHGSETLASGVLFEKSIMDGVIHEFSSILSSKGGEENEVKLSLLLEAKHAHGTYRTDSTLFGEEHVKLSDEDSPNTFWKKLLEGKNPMWKYHSDTPVRNRKRVQYFQDFEESESFCNGGNTKKRKKASDDVADPPVTDSPVVNDERKALGKDHIGALESPKVVALQSSSISASGASGTLNGNDAFGLYSMGGHISGIPEGMLARKDWRQIPCESQRSLHSVLQSDMEKLGKVLDFSEDWTKMVEKFLEYVIENHRVCEEPVTTLQAFKIALSWIAAFLVEHKFNREESLVRIKSELAFSCSREEVDYIYSMLYCMKSMFLESAQGLQLDCFGTNSKRSMVSTKHVNESLSKGEEPMTEKRGSHYSTATKDIKKTISDIQNKCKKKELKLIQLHEEKKMELVNRFADKKRELETKKRLEAAVIRIACSRTSTQSLGDDLKRLDHDYERESVEITSEKDECLKSLEQMHEAAKKKLAEDEACWISRTEKWVQAELKKCVPIESGYNKHFSGICSSNTSKNAPDVQTCNDVLGEATYADTNFMVSKKNQVPEVENTLRTLPGRNTQQGYDVVASRIDKAMDISTSSGEQPAEEVATQSPSNEHASITVPEILIPASCHEKFRALNVHISENQTCDRMSSVAPEISQSSANLAKSAFPELSSNREEALVTIESDRTSHFGHDADKILDQQNEEACSLDKVIHDELALPQPAFVVETRGSAEFDQDDQDICPMLSSPAENQPNPAATIEGQDIGTSAEPHLASPDAGEIGDSALSDQETMGPQDACSLPSPLVGTQSDLAANINGQNITTVAQLHTAGSDAVETGGSAVPDQGAQDASPLPFSLPGDHPDAAVNIQSLNNTTATEPHTTGSDASPLPFSSPENHLDAAVNIEGLNNTTVTEPHTTGSDASPLAFFSPENHLDAAVNIEGLNNTTVTEPHTTGSDASPLPFSSPENHHDAAVNTEGLNNTTVSEPHTTRSDACEMEITEPVPQVEQSTFANNLVHEGGVEPSASIPASVPSLLNNITGQSTVQHVPQIPFPAFNDPFQYEVEKLQRESENTKKTYEEKKSSLKAELKRKMAEVIAEYQIKMNAVEAENKARAMENEKNKNFVDMNKLLANAFSTKCTHKNISHPSANSRGTIQQIALRAAQQVSALRNYTAPAPARPSAPARAPPPLPARVPAPFPARAPATTRPPATARAPAPAHTPTTARAPAPSRTPVPGRAPLQPQTSSFRSSVPRSSGLPLHSALCPMPQPRQPLIYNTVPSPAASLATTPIVNARLRSPAPHLNAYRPASSVPIATATQTSSPLPQAVTYSSTLIPQQQKQQHKDNNDVVCLSDDE